jgi:hypothetical protein
VPAELLQRGVCKLQTQLMLVLSFVIKDGEGCSSMRAMAQVGAGYDLGVALRAVQAKEHLGAGPEDAATRCKGIVEKVPVLEGALPMCQGLLQGCWSQGAAVVLVAGKDGLLVATSADGL